MRRRELAPDERALWDVFTRDITPLPSSQRDSGKTPHAASARFEVTNVSEKSAKHSSRGVKLAQQNSTPVKAPHVTPRLKIGDRLPGLDDTSWRALTKSKHAIRRKLDLHGLTAQKAFIALRDFLVQAYRDDIRYVEVVTGLGTGGEGGVLRRELPHWLERHDIRPLILGVVHTHRSNKGAVRILLRAGRRSALSL